MREGEGRQYLVEQGTSCLFARIRMYTNTLMVIPMPRQRDNAEVSLTSLAMSGSKRDFTCNTPYILSFPTCPLTLSLYSRDSNMSEESEPPKFHFTHPHHHHHRHTDSPLFSHWIPCKPPHLPHQLGPLLLPPPRQPLPQPAHQRPPPRIQQPHLSTKCSDASSAISISNSTARNIAFDLPLKLRARLLAPDSHGSKAKGFTSWHPLCNSSTWVCSDPGGPLSGGFRFSNIAGLERFSCLSRHRSQFQAIPSFHTRQARYATTSKQLIRVESPSSSSSSSLASNVLHP